MARVFFPDGRYNRYFWHIRLEIYRIPYFNMLFQLVLTKYFKSELFSCLAKVDQLMPKACWSSAAGKCSPLWTATVHEREIPSGIVSLLWPSQRLLKETQSMKSILLKWYCVFIEKESVVKRAAIISQYYNHEQISPKTTLPFSLASVALCIKRETMKRR